MLLPGSCLECTYESSGSKIWKWSDRSLQGKFIQETTYPLSVLDLTVTNDLRRSGIPRPKVDEP